MKTITKALTIVCLLVTGFKAHATFSIIAIDPPTKEIGSAGATCIFGVRELGGAIIINDIIPGRGGVNAQASICVNPNINLDLTLDRLNLGNSASETLAWILENDQCPDQDFDPSFRQYGIVDLDAEGKIRVASHTGESNLEWKGDIAGPTYSIQGNILSGPEVLENMETAFLTTEGMLAEKLMAAMQAAKTVGADSRCTRARTSSTTAYLRVVRPQDDATAPFLELNVTEARRGTEPIDLLQEQFDAWKTANTPKPPRLNITLAPDLSQIHISVEASPNSSYQLQYSQDLKIWFDEPRVPILIFDADTSPKVATVSSDQSEQRFYRIRKTNH